jgi:flagellar hook-length control protein FliK
VRPHAVLAAPDRTVAAHPDTCAAGVAVPQSSNAPQTPALGMEPPPASQAAPPVTGETVALTEGTAAASVDPRGGVRPAASAVARPSARMTAAAAPQAPLTAATHADAPPPAGVAPDRALSLATAADRGPTPPAAPAPESEPPSTPANTTAAMPLPAAGAPEPNALPRDSVQASMATAGDPPAAPVAFTPALFTPVLFAPAPFTPVASPDGDSRPSVAAAAEAKVAPHPPAGIDAPKAEAAAPPAAHPFAAASSRSDPSVAIAEPAAPAPAERAAPPPVSSIDQAKAPPAEQLGAILVASTRTQAGDQHLTVRLDPAELGRVNITIAQPRAAAAAVTLTVERPETLLMILRDTPALHRALDRAGIPAEARTVAFELAPQRPASPQQPHGQGSHASSGSASDLASRDQSQRPARQPPRDAHGMDLANNADDPTENEPVAYTRMWQRPGIDITA